LLRRLEVPPKTHLIHPPEIIIVISQNSRAVFFFLVAVTQLPPISIRIRIGDCHWTLVNVIITKLSTAIVRVKFIFIYDPNGTGFTAPKSRYR